MCGGDGGGKGALLTATVALASGERVESLARTAETAAVEKPLPPHSLGIFMAKKPLWRMYSQASGGRSAFWMVW